MRTLEEKIQARTESHVRRRMTKRGTQWALQNSGMSRREARRAAFGDTRREATSHPTRGQLLNERIRVNARARRARRAQVLAASFVGAVVEGGL